MIRRWKRPAIFHVGKTTRISYSLKEFDFSYMQFADGVLASPRQNILGFKYADKGNHTCGVLVMARASLVALRLVLSASFLFVFGVSFSNVVCQAFLTMLSDIQALPTLKETKPIKHRTRVQALWCKFHQGFQPAACSYCGIPLRMKKWPCSTDVIVWTCEQSSSDQSRCMTDSGCFRIKLLCWRFVNVEQMVQTKSDWSTACMVIICYGSNHTERLIRNLRRIICCSSCIANVVLRREIVIVVQHSWSLGAFFLCNFFGFLLRGHHCLL